MAERRDEQLALTITLGVAAAAFLAADYASTPYDAEFEAVAAEKGVPAPLLRAIARHESGMRPSAVSPPNANGTRDYGLMQVNERTARALGRSLERLLEPRYSIETAAQLLLALKRELGAKFSTLSWIAAYNAGSPAILRRGVFNVGYAQAVYWHFSLYSLAALVRRRAGR